jgi:hypothetical protein
MTDQDDFFNIDYEGYEPLEILLEDPENFLKIKETLSRIARRNTIGKLLQEWGLIKIKNDVDLDCCPMSQVKIISYKEKKEWNLVPKYNIGKKR